MKSKLFTTSIFLCSILFLFAGCDKDDEEVNPPSFQEIKLNMEDMRFTDLPNLATITEAKGEFDIKKYQETDSLFIVFPKVSVHGSIQQLVLYPSKLPKDMPIREDMFLFSGEIKFSPTTSYTPIVLSEFKYFLMIENVSN
ncbi:MAG: hypothetical protein PHH72_05560 [Parabacteroides sp.]|nr:hypothetical protein [Parabacteroides sp.]